MRVPSIAIRANNTTPSQTTRLLYPVFFSRLSQENPELEMQAREEAEAEREEIIAVVLGQVRMRLFMLLFVSALVLVSCVSVPSVSQPRMHSLIGVYL